MDIIKKKGVTNETKHPVGVTKIRLKSRWTILHLEDIKILGTRKLKVGLRRGYLGRLIDVLGEGNGTPLQSSCLQNPMDGGAW